jgi:transcriptional regulator
MTAPTVNLLQGTLELLILKTLSSGEARHGFEILRWIREVTEGALTIEEGALYPALHRMERRGWVASDWGLSEKNRKAKYYELTARGRRQLEKEEVDWARYVAVVEMIRAATDEA